MQNAIAPLFVPGHKERLRDKALTLGLTALLVDLEDAVPGAEKEAARRGARALLAQAPGVCQVRINPLQIARGFGTGCGREDLAAVVRSGIAGIVAPKIDTVDALRAVDAALVEAERSAGLAAHSVPLGVTIETALGSANVHGIAGARLTRPMRLLFGMGDLTTDLGVDWTRGEEEGALPRAMIALASRAAMLAKPFDTVFTDVADDEGLRASTRRGKSLGYGGKAAIHPKQVAAILAVYRPSQAEQAWARRVVEAATERAGRGDGAFLLENRMIDDPIVARAQDLLAFAAQFGD
ncbi:Citrate lyase subunit beta [Variovorax sp. PBS-H4]|uniref:HpcH/HpaI aldolase/citrate lyase family protein n=1 Tax=Variovorax sp. PBS-H4 TaxID=434008 RepID=UPI00131666E8|nr:CoA ester lyase [Variovorax sp. PBS-H4]VTU27320.1 Citrate lyase subunit beta [Variovorax sp. PBS-H4]